MSVFGGFPCRHEVVACVHGRNNYVRHLKFNIRWRKNFFNPQDLLIEEPLPNVKDDDSEDILIKTLEELGQINNPDLKNKKPKSEVGIERPAPEEYSFLERSKKNSKRSSLNI